MKTDKRPARALYALFAALLLVDCGGGGGGGTTPTVPAAGVSITPANAELVAATIINSVQIVEGFSSGAVFLPGVAVSSTASGFNYPDLFLKQLQWLPALASQSNTGSLTGVLIGPEDVDCTDPLIGGTSGTVTIDGNVADPFLNTITSGDQFNFVFNVCVIDGIVLNGGISLTVTSISPGFDGFPPYTVEFATVLTGFSANDAGFIVTGNGDMSIRLDATISGDVYTELSGTTLSATAGSEAVQLTGFLYDIWNNVISGDYSVELGGTVATTALGGSVSYMTTLPFTGNDFGAPDPTAGEIHVTTTADTSQATVTAETDGITVTIRVDAGGDGLYETTIPTTWVALRAL